VSTLSRSETASATSGSDNSASVTQARISALIDRCLALPRNWLLAVFLATVSSHGNAGAGTSASRRQATRKTSLTTSSASCCPTRLTA
jgi:hypothetical protein